MLFPNGCNETTNWISFELDFCWGFSFTHGVVFGVRDFLREPPDNKTDRRDSSSMANPRDAGLQCWRKPKRFERMPKKQLNVEASIPSLFAQSICWWSCIWEVWFDVSIPLSIMNSYLIITLQLCKHVTDATEIHTHVNLWWRYSSTATLPTTLKYWRKWPSQKQTNKFRRQKCLPKWPCPSASVQRTNTMSDHSWMGELSG